jgi:hypothetical protein
MMCYCTSIAWLHHATRHRLTWHRVAWQAAVGNVGYLTFIYHHLWGCACAAHWIGLTCSGVFYLHGSSLSESQRGGLGARCRTRDQTTQPPLDVVKNQMAKYGMKPTITQSSHKHQPTITQASHKHQPTINDLCQALYTTSTAALSSIHVSDCGTTRCFCTLPEP